MNRFSLRSVWGSLSLHLVAFIAAPASARPLAALRIGVAGVLLYRALALSGHLLEIYGPLGFIQWSISETLILQGLPRMQWVVNALAPLGISADSCVWLIFLSGVGSALCLLVGWHTRWAAFMTFLIVLSMNHSAYAVTYGVNAFLHIGLFYCMCFPVGHAYSLDRWQGRVCGSPTASARLGLRVLQLHICAIYLSATWHKAWGEQWWNGEAIWRALMRNDLGQFDLSWYAWMANVPWVPMLACWGTLLVEGAYAFFVWPRYTRTWMALATIGLHLGIGIFMGLWSFSATMIVLTGSAFLISPEPSAAADPVTESLPAQTETPSSVESVMLAA